jgi:streptomycin 3"-adenylyltransferase
MNGQLDEAVAALRELLGDDLVAVYLFGSAVLGGLRPRSDLDVMAVAARGTTRDEKRALVDRLLTASMRPRPLEVTIVVQSEIRPWRYPPRMDLQYGDWWRAEFERGDVEPWPSATNPDLASLIRMVLAADTPLLGPPPAAVFDPVPRDDFVAALVHGVEGLRQDLEWDTRNVVLTLARIWNGIQTDQLVSKDAAAGWALARLPEQLRPVLATARDAYLGLVEDRWDDRRPEVRAYVDHVTAIIDGLTDRTTSSGPGAEGSTPSSRS